MSIKSRLFSLSSHGEDMSKLAELEAQVVTLSASLEAVQTELATAQEATAALTAELASAIEEKAALAAKLEEVEAAEKAAAEAAALAIEQERKSRLVAAVGEAKAETLFASLNVLDEAAFSAVVDSFAEAKSSVDSSVLMEEQGIGSDGNLVNQEGQEFALVAQMIAARKSK